MTDTYDLKGGLTVFDGQDAVLNDFRESTALDRRPASDEKMSIYSQVSAIAGVIPSATSNKVSVVTARQDGSVKDVGVGVYPIAQNGLLLSTADQTSRNGISFLTVSATLRTFITGYFFMNDSNAACDNTAIGFTITPVVGSSAFMVNFVKTTLTANHDSSAIQFANPIEVTKSSNIALTNIFTVGASKTVIIVFGYTQAV